MKNTVKDISMVNLMFFWFVFFIASTTISQAAQSIDVETEKSQNINNTIVPANEILTNLKEVGSTKLTKFFFDIYQSRLLSDSGEYETKLNSGQKIEGQKQYQELAFEITYLRNIKSKYLVKETIKQWHHLNINEQDYQEFVPQIAHLWPNINKGDSLLLYISANYSAFYLNNEYIGQVSGMNFGMLFLSIWLSENTSEPELRRQLLGLDDLADI